MLSIEALYLKALTFHVAITATRSLVTETLNDQEF